MKPPHQLNLLLAGVTIVAEPIVEMMGDGYFPDRDWKFVDKNGHGHYYEPRGSKHYPTLTLDHRGCTYSDHDDDCEGASFYKCSTCGEEVEPGTCYQMAREEVVGHSYTIIREGANRVIRYALTEREFKELMRVLTDATSDVLDGALADAQVVDVEYRSA